MIGIEIETQDQFREQSVPTISQIEGREIETAHKKVSCPHVSPMCPPCVPHVSHVSPCFLRRIMDANCCEKVVDIVFMSIRQIQTSAVPTGGRQSCKADNGLAAV